MLLLFLQFIFLPFINCYTLSCYEGIFDDLWNITMNHSKLIIWPQKLIISFAILNEYGIITNDYPNYDYKIFHTIAAFKNAKPNGKVHISIFGSKIDEHYLYAANHTEQFIESILKYFKRYNLDGIDIDWETPSINFYSDALVTLIKTCTTTFNKKYEVSHAIWPYVHTPTTVGLLANIVDEINIMTYYMDTDKIEDLVESYNKSGFPYSKMVLGIESETGMDTIDIIRGKIKLMIKYGLKGLFMWRLDNDGISKEVLLVNKYMFRKFTKINKISLKDSDPPSFKTIKMILLALKEQNIYLSL